MIIMGKKTVRHTPEQAVRKLRDIEVLLAQGKPLELTLRELEISEPTNYRWKKQYGLMTSDDAKEFRRLQRENAKLKQALAEAVLDKTILQDVLSRKA
jgi:putative transposase